MMSECDRWWRLYPCDEHLCNEASDSAPYLAVSPNNRGLAYGDGFFSTMGVVDGEILWSQYHHNRLLSHAQALQFDIDAQGILAHLQTHAEHLGQGVLKVIVTRVPQETPGYSFVPTLSGSACEVWLKSTAITNIPSSFIQLPTSGKVFKQYATRAVCLSAQLACLPPTLVGLKTLNCLDNVLASGELAVLKNKSLKHPNATLAFGEGLVRDMTGHWVEGTMSNVFYQLSASIHSVDSNIKSDDNDSDSDSVSQVEANYLTHGQWFTPSMSQSGVAGVMRQVIIDSLANTKNPVIIRSLSDDDLPQLSQLFFCNAVRGVMPMASLTLLSGEVVGF